ncbi:beta-galactosidase [Hamadaea tsunoensis]|uniref:beta-galactosidase n=1 Tax=Hamadaea tsunoensis TaxID=53368 RepID=UPI0004184A71|nr:beta-galactosidase [Hamadaea tsunoensis]
MSAYLGGDLWFGGDFNPEQWPEESWADDLALMKKAHVSVVTVGVFAWSRLEPAPGEFDFGWLDRLLDRLGAAGIGVCLATPTASPPPWFTWRHPDGLPVGRDGVRLTHGSRDTFCVSSPAFAEASRRIATELARRYGHHPAVRLWHVHNEYGTWCFCDHCAEAFRSWLSRRHGSLDGLNAAWTTDFWSQRYASFAEVLPPRATQYRRNPAQDLDYRRFMSDALLANYTMQRDILRTHTDRPVTTNFVLGGWVPVDHARWAREVDLVAIDSYPAARAFEDALAERAFAADLARGWARAADHPNGRWLLMEHAPGPRLAEVAEAYLSRGSIGALYFQWRASRGGAEQWHPALVPHSGVLPAAVTELGASLRDRTPVTVDARTALVYDAESMWGWQAEHLPLRLEYETVLLDWHRKLAARGAVDVIPPSAGGAYSLVVAPAQLIHRDVTALGETVVLNGGLVDASYRVTDAVEAVIGARVADRRFSDTSWFDVLEPTTATVVERTAEGLPLVTRNGNVYYVADSAHIWLP